MLYLTEYAEDFVLAHFFQHCIWKLEQRTSPISELIWI